MTRPPIPPNTDEVTAQWMQQALAAGGASNLPPIKEVVLQQIGDAGVSTMGALMRCHLTYCEPQPPEFPDPRRPAAAQKFAAPETVILKLPGANEKNLRLSRRLALHKREYDFYSQAAPHTPVRSPALLYGDFEAGTDRFVLVLEDLRDMQMVSQLDGASPEQAIRAIRAVARLHGTFWNRTDLPPLTGFYDVVAPQRRPLLQLVYIASLVPTLRNFGSFFSDETRRLAEAYGPRIADHIGHVAAGPITLMHGDFRLDNILFPADLGAVECAPFEQTCQDVAVIDWQVSALSTPLYDAAYFLGSSVTTDVRRQIERQALEEYTDIICDMGVQGFTFEECWRLYREGMLGCLLTAVLMCGGLDLGSDRGRQLAEVGLQRTLTAIEDLDAGEFLPAPAPPFSRAGAFAALSRGAYSLLKTLRR